MVSGRVEDKVLVVERLDDKYPDLCVQCGAKTEVILAAHWDTEYPLCSEDAIDLALELVREAKAAMQGEKKRGVVR